MAVSRVTRGGWLQETGKVTRVRRGGFQTETVAPVAPTGFKPHFVRRQTHNIGMGF